MRDVKPLKPSVAPPALPKADTSVIAARPARVPPPPPPSSPKAPPLALDRIAGVDKRLAERLKRGQLAIDAMLDLHGLTQEEAHRQLDAFLAGAAHAGRRCLLVITGKGLWREDSGILREMVPRWLNEAPNRARVLAIARAQPRHGGAGALYVLLKRRREQ